MSRTYWKSAGNGSIINPKELQFFELLYTFVIVSDVPCPLFDNGAVYCLPCVKSHKICCICINFRYIRLRTPPIGGFRRNFFVYNTALFYGSFFLRERHPVRVPRRHALKNAESEFLGISLNQKETGRCFWPEVQIANQSS